MKPLFSVIVISLLVSYSFCSDVTTCCSITRSKISERDAELYDSLYSTPEYLNHGTIKFISDSMSVVDTVRIKRLNRDSTSSMEYYPLFLQFHGEFKDFARYALMIDPSLDSLVCCNFTVRVYASNKCDFCDSGFFSASQYYPTQYNYYKYHDLYGAIFSLHGIKEIQIFVDGENKTYLPFASDVAVYAPSKTMKKKWYVPNTDYGAFFPDFPSTTTDFSFDNNTDSYIWKESAAEKVTANKRHK